MFFFHFEMATGPFAASPPSLFGPVKDFGADLSLKPIERQRVQKWVTWQEEIAGGFGGWLSSMFFSFFSPIDVASFFPILVLWLSRSVPWKVEASARARWGE